MWLKRCCAMAAIVLLLFSVSLQPCYAEATDTGSPLYLYINPNSAAYDPITECTAYPVPWNKFEIGKTVNVVSEYIDYHFGVQSSLFRPLTTSGTQPTIYYAYGVVSSDGVPQPAYISTSGSIIGTAYNDRGGSLGSITQIRVSQMEGGSSHMRVAVCRTTLPHNTAMFSFPDSSGAPGFRVYRGTSGLGFAFAYVVNTDDSAVLSYLDQIVQLLTNMDADLDTVVQLLRSCVDYLNTLVHTTDDIAQNVNGIYDLLKNALAAESAELSQNAQHVGDTVLQQADGEQYWKDKNDENFKALDISNFSFSSLLVTSLSAVGGWFANLWDSLGPVTIIFTFPLTLGIALVVVGRVARSAGKGYKSNFTKRYLSFQFSGTFCNLY